MLERCLPRLRGLRPDLDLTAEAQALAAVRGRLADPGPGGPATAGRRPGRAPGARFCAQAIELERALNGLETGETFWYTAHLGGARDRRA